MPNISFVFGVIGNITALLMFLSPIKTFCWVVKKKSTEGYEGIPYIITLLNTSIWTFYGVLKPGGLFIVTINAAGIILQFIYITLFLIYAPKDKKVKTAKLVGLLDVASFSIVVVVTLLALHGNLRITVVGFLGALLAIAMYASPLLIMKTVIKTKSVEYMPFWLSFFLFTNGAVWTIYAILVKDFFLGVPNATGFILGTVQLMVYAIYKNKSTSTSKVSTDVMKQLEEAKGKIKKNSCVDVEEGQS